MIVTGENIQTDTIYPTKRYNRPPPPPIIALHGLDLLSDPIHIRNHRFYHRPQSLSPIDVIDKLKSSLAEALELYPSVAGVVQADGNGALHIVIDAKNTSGTPFLVETKDTPFIGDTEDFSPRLEMLLPPSSSTLAVKVTQFSCGTVAVATSIHHQVVDLSGYLDFLEVWAELARDEPIDFRTIPSDWSHTPGRFFSSLKRKLTPPAPPPGFKVLPTPPTEGPPFSAAAVTRWKFTKAALEQLKTDFSPSPSSAEECNKPDEWISTGDALAALAWGAIARARNQANLARTQVFGGGSSEPETETMAMAADGRHRSPEGNMGHRQYFGNFNVLPSITVSRADLLSLTHDSASRVAREIRNALKLQLSPEAIADKITFMEDPQHIKPNGHLIWTADVALTNWCRFDLQGPKFDFGWGKPFLATAGSGGLFPPGYAVLMQNKSSGEVSAMITVEQEGVDGLKRDFLLNEYATLLTHH